LLGISPRLFAACNVLHRYVVSRHPPYALIFPIRKYINHNRLLLYSIFQCVTCLRKKLENFFRSCSKFQTSKSCDSKILYLNICLGIRKDQMIDQAILLCLNLSFPGSILLLKCGRSAKSRDFAIKKPLFRAEFHTIGRLRL